MNRNLLFALAGVGLLVIAGLVYFFFFSQKSPNLSLQDGGISIGTSSETASQNQMGDSLPVDQERTVVEEAPRFIKISSDPVSLGVNIRSEKTSRPVPIGGATTTLEIVNTSVDYVERETGNIYTFNESGRTVTRITNQTLPGVVDAVWSKDGSRAFVRYLSRDTGDSIQSYALGRKEGTSYVLEEGLSSLAVTPKGLLFTLLSNSNGSIGTLAGADGSGAKTLFTSPLSALKIRPAGNDFIAYTKASAGSSGYAFLVNGTTGTFERVAGPLTGLTALPSPSGKKVLFGYRSGSTLRLEILDVATRTSIVLPIATLTEKCVWSADETDIFCAVPRALSGTLPDDWYQGTVSFSDRFWKVDVVNRLATLLFDTRELAEVEVDAVSLAIDDASRLLVFTNKADGALYAYEI